MRRVPQLSWADHHALQALDPDHARAVADVLRYEEPRRGLATLRERIDARP